MRIEEDDLTRPVVHALLAEHLAQMRAQSPACSVHALDLGGLRAPGVSFWCAWDGAQLMGCGALKALSPVHGELKSMRTAAAHRRKGVARAMLAHLLAVARERGYERVSLETGTAAGFLPAIGLYESAGFERCGPFAGYREDPHSLFMTRRL
ncbi:GNAT family N-acetyltransferase [Arenimonas sp.]|uniref:GNAT family N-acetyltransferase n=1 Tax=Arenimonas sp. TaxID=1872635 RepID=UPI0035B214A2